MPRRRASAGPAADPQFVAENDVIAEAYRSGYEQGYKKGLRAGLRRAKGKPDHPKPHGGQKLLEDIWALQFFDDVNESITDRKISLSAAVDDYRRRMTQRLKRECVDQMPEFAQRVFTFEPTRARASLIRLYTRMKKGTDKIDPEMRRQYAVLKQYSSKT